MKIQYTTALLAMLLAHGARAQYTTGTGNLNVVPGNGQPGNAAVAGSATVTGDITVVPPCKEPWR